MGLSGNNRSGCRRCEKNSNLCLESNSVTGLDAVVMRKILTSAWNQTTFVHTAFS
jgi:hypothetical protein